MGNEGHGPGRRIAFRELAERRHDALERIDKAEAVGSAKTQAARLCGFSLASWDRMSAAGRNPAGLRIGAARMYRTEELVAWVRHDCPRRAEWSAIWEVLQKQRNRR